MLNVSHRIRRLAECSRRHASGRLLILDLSKPKNAECALLLLSVSPAASSTSHPAERGVILEITQDVYAMNQLLIFISYINHEP